MIPQTVFSIAGSNRLAVGLAAVDDNPLRRAMTLQAAASRDPRSEGGRRRLTSLTSDGMEEMEQMLVHARRTAEEWKDFLDVFVDDEELIARASK